MKYTSRLNAPSRSNNYYFKDNIFYKCGYGMPNCTCYAFGRWYEILNKVPSLPTSNAGGWYDKCHAYKKGNTPKLGAVAVWKKLNTNRNSGHVSVVEKISSDGSITCSNSGWKSTYFYLTTIKPPYKVSGYEFKGFIYLPINFDNETVVNTTLTYKVKKGDTLYGISKRYNTTVNKLINLNANKYPKIKTSKGNYIQVGWILKIK